MTYFLPEKAGSHDFKFGYEYIYDSYHFGINGQSGPYRLSYATPTSPSPDRIRFVDTGLPSQYGSSWNASPTLDTHHSAYAQDRWSPNNRLTITAGVRMDYQDAGYGAGERKPEICDATTPLQAGDGGSIFPCDTPIRAASFLKNTNISARIGFSANLDGTGRTVLKGFYGRYYNNLADGFSAANPGGQNYIDYNFHDLNGNGKYDGVQELGTFRDRIGGASSTVPSNTKTPYTDEFSGTIERQFWGESSIRGTYVRKMQREYVPFYYSPLVTAWIGQQNVPIAASYLGTTYNLLDVPNSVADLTDTTFGNWPDGNFTYDTIEVAFTKRAGAKLFFQVSGDYQWRNELRSADIPNWGSASPLSTDPIGVGPQLSLNPNAPNRQKTTMYHAQLAGHYTFPYDIGVGVNYRFQSGFPYAAIVPDGSVTLPNGDNPNLCNFECSFFTQNLDQNRSEAVNLLNFRIDKSIPFGRAKATLMLDLYNVLNADPVTNFSLGVGPNYKRVIAVLDPRVFQMGFRVEF
jgi:hypothetical protein